jgi:hypothetical protein
MTWIDLAGRGDPVLVVDGRIHLRPHDVADPELRRLATELWDEFQAVRDLAGPVADELARLRRTADGPVRLVFPDAQAFQDRLDAE